MKLYVNKPSPYGRKVLVVAHEKGLIDRIEIVECDPWRDPAELLAVAPAGKVPLLVTGDGLGLSESTTICEYLDEIGAGPSLVGGARWPMMARCGLGQGLIDAAFASVIEKRRPPAQQSADWLARQRRAIDRALAAARPEGGRFDLGDVFLAVGLGYLDFRLPEIPWRQDHPALAAWFDAVAQRPSLQATKP